jgi:RNA recognition motif-containing protein
MFASRTCALSSSAMREGLRRTAGSVSTKLFLKNLPRTTTQEELRSVLEGYGKLAHFYTKGTLGDLDENKPHFGPTIAVATFEDIEAAISAQEELDGSLIFKTRAEVSFSVNYVQEVLNERRTNNGGGGIQLICHHCGEHGHTRVSKKRPEACLNLLEPNEKGRKAERQWKKTMI